MKKIDLPSGLIMKREFTSLTPQEALHVAIFIEERNADLYQQFAEMFAEFKDPESLEIAQVFWEMAQEERTHGTFLQERYFERYGTQACVVTEQEIREFIEVPRLENSDIFAVARTRSAIAPRRTALKVALEAELSAQNYYRELAGNTHDKQLRAIYVELAGYETNHTALLEKKLEEANRAVGGGDPA